MLNPFPIQFLALLAYALLRIFVGAVLLNLSMTHLTKRHDMKHALQLPLLGNHMVTLFVLAAVECIAGVMFILGFYTQYAALATVGLSIFMLIFHRSIPSPYIPDRIFYVLLLGTALSLFITGAGAFAFDLPI